MFSVCGRLMATAGQDHIIRVWVLKNYLGHFTRMRDRYSQQTRGKDDPTMQDFDNFRMHDERVCLAFCSASILVGAELPSLPLFNVSLSFA